MELAIAVYWYVGVTGVIDPERKQCNLAIAMELAIAVYWYVGVTGVIDPERKHLH
jgi:hypothetical protein